MKKKNLMFAALIAATAFGMSGCSFISGLFDSPDSSSSGSDGVDTEAPVISVTGVPTSCNVGDTVTLPAATATDNVDGEVDVYVYLVEPSGVMKKVSFGEKVKLSKAGVYQIRYLSIDAFGNLNILYYDITVA